MPKFSFDITKLFFIFYFISIFNKQFTTVKYWKMQKDDNNYPIQESRNLIYKTILLLDGIFANPYLKFLLVCLVGSTILFGIFITPDGFQYLEGAHNTLRGYGFVMNCNLMHIVYFQPLYPYTMIPFIYIFGYTTLAVILCNIFLFIAAYYVYDRLLSNAIPEINPVIKFLSIVITIYSYYLFVYSEALLLVLIGLYVNILFFYKGKTVLKYLYLAVLLFEIFSTKNSALLVLLPLHLSQIEFKWKNIIRINLKHVISLFGILVIFLASKLIFHTMSSHHFALGSGRYPLKEYLIQVYQDFAVWIFGRSFMHLMTDHGIGLYLNIFSFIALIFVFFQSKFESRGKFYLFLLYTLVLHLIVFLTTPLGEPFNERFLFWFNFVFIFIMLTSLQNSYVRILFSLVIFMNIMHITYSRYKIYHTKEVVLKLKYELDPRTFKTTVAHPPSIYYDEKTSKTIIISPAFPWYVNK